MANRYTKIECSNNIILYHQIKVYKIFISSKCLHNRAEVVRPKLHLRALLLSVGKSFFPSSQKYFELVFKSCRRVTDRLTS